jgi:hypothetical protein
VVVVTGQVVTAVAAAKSVCTQAKLSMVRAHQSLQPLELELVDQVHWFPGLVEQLNIQ